MSAFMDRVSKPSLAQAQGTRNAPTAFEEFFREEHARLLRALFLVTGNSQEAEDLMQDAFVKLWDRWDRVRTMEDPVGYLYRTAMNAFRSRYRRVVRLARHPMSFGPGPDDLAAVEDRDRALRALRSMSPRQRVALVLTEYLGYSSEEAANVMGVRAATVRALAHQGRERLQGVADE